MLNSRERRIARLAISRFGADPVRVRQVCARWLQRRRTRPEQDLLEVFVEEQLLPRDLAEQLRQELDRTQVAEPTTPAPADSDGQTPIRQLGRYRLLRKIGEGAMGEVYLAHDPQENRPVAIKILAKHLEENASLVERFQREAELASRLNHPHLVRGYEMGRDEQSSQRYFVMEYVDGISAQEYLDRHGRFSIEDALHIILDVAHGLEYAHAHNIIHRDIKPENILITRSGVAKLTDLGLSKQTDQSSVLTGMRQGFGTPYYMPYEQAINARDADARSDIFALGATLYHMLTGRVPFDGKNQIEILEKKEQGIYTPAYVVNPEIPEDLSAILDRMLARRPEDRFQTVSEVIVAVERTGLAGKFLSFADQELARRDPVARLRARALEEVTLLDLSEATEQPNFWYVRYRTRSGAWRQRRYRQEQILQAIARGELGPADEIAASPEGPFHKLSHYRRFRPALQEAALRKTSLPSRSPWSRRWLWLGTLLMVLLGLLLLVWLLW
jgi:serine/threonine protein kinase